MAELKRDEVKYLRDGVKSQYNKGTECHICGSDDDLDFHHFCSISELWAKWKKANKVVISSVDDIMDIRDIFIAEYLDELLHQTATLCHDHHLKLHSIYGRNPILATAKKQARWVEKQRVKHGLV